MPGPSLIEAVSPNRSDKYHWEKDLMSERRARPVRGGPVG
jgi:hypothetical protein